MAIDYTKFEVNLLDLNSCLLFVEAELQIFGLTAPRDTRLKLTLEAGADRDGQTVHRPWARMAAILGRAINTTHINKGEGAASAATFRDADKTLQGWLDDQASADLATGVTGSSTAVRRSGSRSIRVSSSF